MVVIFDVCVVTVLLVLVTGTGVTWVSVVTVVVVGCSASLVSVSVCAGCTIIVWGCGGVTMIGAGILGGFGDAIAATPFASPFIFVLAIWPLTLVLTFARFVVSTSWALAV